MIRSPRSKNNRSVYWRIWDFSRSCLIVFRLISKNAVYGARKRKSVGASKRKGVLRRSDLPGHPSHTWLRIGNIRIHLLFDSGYNTFQKRKGLLRIFRHYTGTEELGQILPELSHYQKRRYTCEGDADEGRAHSHQRRQGQRIFSDQDVCSSGLPRVPQEGGPDGCMQ